MALNAGIVEHEGNNSNAICIHNLCLCINFNILCNIKPINLLL